MVRTEEGLGLDHAQNVAFLHDQQVLTIDLHFRARPLAEQDAIASLHVESDDVALVVTGAGADGDDLIIMKESDVLGVLS